MGMKITHLPCCHDLIKLLARIAVEEYLSELRQQRTLLPSPQQLAERLTDHHASASSNPNIQTHKSGE